MHNSCCWVNPGNGELLQEPLAGSHTPSSSKGCYDKAAMHLDFITQRRSEMADWGHLTRKSED